MRLPNPRAGSGLLGRFWMSSKHGILRVGSRGNPNPQSLYRRISRATSSLSSPWTVVVGKPSEKFVGQRHPNKFCDGKCCVFWVRLGDFCRECQLLDLSYVAQSMRAETTQGQAFFRTQAPGQPTDWARFSPVSRGAPRPRAAAYPSELCY